jgi:hypothetical protein
MYQDNTFQPDTYVSVKLFNRTNINKERMKPKRHPSIPVDSVRVNNASIKSA